jgi:hypothetical protein
MEREQTFGRSGHEEAGGNSMKIPLVEGLLLPIPPKARMRLFNVNGMFVLWNNSETIYRAMQKFSSRMCRGYSLSQDTAEDCVHSTCIEICRIAERDGRRTSRDKRTSAGRRTKGTKVPEDFSRATKPMFTDWVKYAMWVLGRLKLNIQRARDTQSKEEARSRVALVVFRQEQEADIPSRATPSRRAEWD